MQRWSPPAEFPHHLSDLVLSDNHLLVQHLSHQPIDNDTSLDQKTSRVTCTHILQHISSLHRSSTCFVSYFRHSFDRLRLRVIPSCDFVIDNSTTVATDSTIKYRSATAPELSGLDLQRFNAIGNLFRLSQLMRHSLSTAYAPIYMTNACTVRTIELRTY